MARCPIHQELLQTYNITLTKMGKSFDCVAGKCPWCSRLYLNIPFFHHFDEVEIQGKQYIYHKQLAQEYSVAENRALIKPSPSKKPQSSEEKTPKPAKQKSNSKHTANKKKNSKQKLLVSTHASPKGTTVKKGDLREEKVFRKKYLYVINNPQLPHRFGSVKYVESIPQYCDTDGYELVNVNQAVFSTLGINVRTKGMCCVRCSTVYLHHSKKEQIIREASLRKKCPLPNPQKGKNFSWSKTLLQIPVMDTNETRCPFCKREFSGMSNIKYRLDDDTERYTLARSCTACKLVILDQTQFKQIQHQLGNKVIYTIQPHAFKSAAELMTETQKIPITKKATSVIQPLPYEQEMTRPINLSESGKTITIFAQKCHCAKCHKKYSRHTIRSRTAKVLSASKQIVDVNVMFCAGCGNYYMAYESFKQYKKVYGRLLFECELSSELQTSNASYLDFAPDSLLSRWGYNVKKDMPIEHRQAILQFLLETRRITKFEAVEMIKGFIQLKDRQPQYYDACERWREDILFINNYRIKDQDIVYGLTFKQGGRITK